MIGQHTPSIFRQFSQVVTEPAESCYGLTSIKLSLQPFPAVDGCDTDKTKQLQHASLKLPLGPAASGGTAEERRSDSVQQSWLQRPRYRLCRQVRILCKGKPNTWAFSAKVAQACRNLAPELTLCWRWLACSGGDITALHLSACKHRKHVIVMCQDSAPGLADCEVYVPCVIEVCAQVQMSLQALFERCCCIHGMWLLSKMSWLPTA